ncbi:hypothetical protein Poli38472_003553 [Pythium oligandrum]|uniref:Cation/H+ exchanger transmembrane domain-containing protein n=1 Tax=Pythium oligandrum TaxID=41045 RepID=A0A8K1FGB4_PYTOL|nr:hypothetical protein Poli38472_003553 [Pythium oligandrum]|eukprot:TMW57628.1 hypothetical protein Poli38472_003553 [Pythium oligandrum]
MEAGFTTYRHGFFANIFAILLLGVVGTVAATILTAVGIYLLGQSPHFPSVSALSPVEALRFGALISAIGPIPTQLVLRKSHAPVLLPELVFGERSLNNAIAIAIFNLCTMHLQTAGTRISTVDGIMLAGQLIAVGFGSLAVAAVIGFSSAFLLQKSDKDLHQHPTYEVSILLLFAYSSYLAAVACNLSGDLAIFASGAFMRHYHMRSVSKASATTFKHMLRTVAFLAENFIFVYLGVSLFAYSESFQWEWHFIIASLVICLAVRAFTVPLLCQAASLWRVQAIPVRYMVVIWFSGLRGAVAFALALNVDPAETRPEHAAIIRSATLFVVLCTAIPFTVLMRPLLHSLDLTHANASHTETRRPDEQTSLLWATRNEEEAQWLRRVWTRFDHDHLQPHFGRVDN